MQAGRELDALVAEKVMGISVRENPNHKAYGEGTTHFIGSGFSPLPEYSEEIEAAWEVVEKMSLLKNEYALFQCDWATDEDGNPNVNQWKVMKRCGGWEFEDFAEGVTAPHAICLAALKAVGA